MSIVDEKYVAFTTFRQNGEPKSTPIWIAEAGDLIGFTTASDSWKMRRLRNDNRCELRPSDQRGRVSPHSAVVTATAREATADERTRIEEAIDAKYGWMTKVIPLVYKAMRLMGRDAAESDSGIVIELD